MWVEELQNGKYKFCERYEVDGKTKKVSVTNIKNTKKVREQMFVYLHERIDAILENKKSTEEIILFGACVDEWIAIRREQVKPSTHNCQSALCKTIKDKLGCIPINKIQAGDINSFLYIEMSKNSITYGTALNYKGILNGILKFIHKYKNINMKEIIGSIEIPKMNMTVKDELKYLEHYELTKLLKYFEDNDNDEIARMVRFQVSTGLRFGEMVAINYNDIDLKDGTITIDKTYNRYSKVFQTPKNGKSRTIYINDNVKQLINEQIHFNNIKTLIFNHKKDNNLLFRSDGGKPFNIDTFNKLLKKTPIEKHLTSHIFRHTFITLAVERGIDKNLIARQVGHADTKMIDKVYSHFTSVMEQQQREAMASFKII